MIKWIVRLAIAAASLFAISLGYSVWQGSSAMLRPPWYVANDPGGSFRPLNDTEEGEWLGYTKDPMRDFGYAFEDVEIPAEDGSTLRGWYVPPGGELAPEDSVVGIITVHGAGADRRDLLNTIPILHEAGYPVVAFDCREHGTSDGTGRGISYGVREHADVRSVVAWARRELGWSRVGVIGSSQGGAAVLLAAALDPDIDAVISENPFTSMHDLIQYTVRDDVGDDRFSASLVDLAASIALWRAGGSSLPAPIDVVDQIAPRPLLLMHGTADEIVPVEHSERLHAKAGETAELWLAPDARHSALINRYPKEFRDRVLRFFDRALRPEMGTDRAQETS